MREQVSSFRSFGPDKLEIRTKLWLSPGSLIPDFASVNTAPRGDLGRSINMGVYYTRLMIFYEVIMFSSLQRLLLDRNKKMSTIIYNLHMCLKKGLSDGLFSLSWYHQKYSYLRSGLSPPNVSILCSNSLRHQNLNLFLRTQQPCSFIS